MPVSIAGAGPPAASAVGLEPASADRLMPDYDRARAESLPAENHMSDVSGET
ncbi:hypothetical protein ACIBI8_28560 [Streptomyces sp. NPDC050529]|uniref:hypothetical protein n=1 Tax=Streptomyces sp. NPDC050529 TaxID=3365624 RepID=UPI0037A89540